MAKRRYIQAASLVLGMSALMMTGCSCLLRGDANLDVMNKDRGIASWYGSYFHGWVTASGEIYDMHDLTAAHRTLPLGTVVRVTNAMNGTHVRVRINDRGPYVKGRILDLSFEAARRIGMVKDGVAPVLVEVLGLPPSGSGELVARSAAPGSGGGLTTLSLPRSGEEGRRTGRRAARDVQDQQPSALRQGPVDILRERRARRVADILAAEERVYTVAALVHD